MEPIQDSSPVFGGTGCDFEEKLTTPSGRACQKTNLLDILNDDCWRVMLRYVPVKDIVRSERVSRRWQAMVQWYLQDTGFRIKIQTITNVWDVVDNKEKLRECTLKLTDNPILFYAVLNKWAPYVVELIYDARNSDDEALWRLGAQCLNLENVTFVRLKDYPSCDWTANFAGLKRICFENCSMPDSCVTDFLKNNTIEELVIRMTDSLTGSFLQNGEQLKNLKTLILNRSLKLEYKHLLSTVEPVNYLSGVTKLELRNLSDSVHVRVHFILEKLPQLEHLTLDSRCGWSDEIGAAVVRLDNLRYLGWYNGKELRGDELRYALRDLNSFKAWSRAGYACTWGLQRAQRRQQFYARRGAMWGAPPEPEQAGEGIVRDFRR